MRAPREIRGALSPSVAGRLAARWLMHCSIVAGLEATEAVRTTKRLEDYFVAC